MSPNEGRGQVFWSLGRLIVIGALLASLLLPVAQASKGQGKRSRISKASYSSPSLGIAGGPEVAQCDSPSSLIHIRRDCAIFWARDGEHSVTFLVDDAVGEQVSGAVYINRALTAKFCSKTPGPIPISPGDQILVSIFNGPSIDGSCPGVATTGEVTGVFYRRG